MQLIKFPLSDTTGKEISLPNNTIYANNVENLATSLPYQDWEIDEVIEKLSEDEQDLLIEKISVLAQSWELTLDSELKAFLQIKYKESKTTFAYTDWLYDLAQEEVYCTYAIEKLNEQKKKANLSLISNKKSSQTSTNSASPANITSINTFSVNEATTITTQATTPAITQAATPPPNLMDDKVLAKLAQSQVCREYAIEQLELAKENSFEFNEIAESNKIVSNDFSFDVKEEAISMCKTNNLINYANQESVFNQDNDSPENYLQETNSSQGYQNEINKPLIVSNYDYHITKGFPNYFRKIPINYFNQQNSNFALANYSWKNSLPLTKAKKALLMHVHQGKPASIHHPPSLPP